ncbi:S1 family peptidase [Pseudoroseomonas ludipueritiae]|uniref:Trypsin-like peptidase domain-containing protein n=1 Tax=Pseudoroseomonas ludipueritiae TaxID=198093 RepID=A0ABR7R836_9PROT|nr:serine protease [Pseudoroseomonas ludipueritiae]MBC9177908.1 trypsin-like peptidase domain-containing protein [Pseudoroseomonas ludipueritiae]
MKRWIGGVVASGTGLALLAAAATWPAQPAASPVSMVAGGWSGSAFAVAPGLLVTNAHVALRCQAQGLPLRVEGRGGAWRVAVLDADADLALLQGPSAGEAVLPLSAAQRLPRGTPVLALGYPTSGTERHFAGQLHSTRGAILRATLTVHDPEGGRAVSFVMTDRQGQEVEPSWEDGLRYFGPAQAARLRWRLEIDAPAHGGSSGGPVLDAAGQVVGVVYAGGRGLTAAIPLEDLRSLLLRAGVAPVMRVPARQRDPDWEAVRDAASRALYRLAC